MFTPPSRYASVHPQIVPDARGRSVPVVLPPAAPAQTLLGIHALRQGERLDHLAARYLSDPAGYWRIAEQNDVMLPEALTERAEIEIPRK